LRKRNIRKIEQKIKAYSQGKISFSEIKESFQGWQAYARWANSYKSINGTKMKIIETLWNKIVWESS
jgi:hypothetical protein